MNLYQIVLTTVATLAFAFSCWLVFWTESAVKFAKSRRTSAHLASQSWYPIWLRFEGIWLSAVTIFFLSVMFKA